MKRLFRLFSVFMAVCLAAALMTGFSYDLSPGLSVLTSKASVQKSCTIHDPVTFTAGDFDRIAGRKVHCILVTELPDIDAGVLKIGGMDVLAFQTISREGLDYLTFTPSSAAGSASFCFKTGSRDASEFSAVSMTCKINILDKKNHAPVAADASFSTIRNIGLHAAFGAYDPDLDVLNCFVTREPKRGHLVLKDPATGSFHYEPDPDFSGTDSFEYQVTDVYGNLSESASVQIKVEKNSDIPVYEDMRGHWGELSAVRIAEKGILTGESVGGKLYFNPDTVVSRGQFLVMLMSAAGMDQDLAPAVSTVLHDDDAIPQWMKKYVSRAVSTGIISGVNTGSGICFQADRAITRAEAAVMMDNLLGLKPSEIRIMLRDYDEIPVWAVQSFVNLQNNGIIRGTGSKMCPNQPLTRAQCAEMLNNMLTYQEQHAEKETFSLLGWLFGK